MIRKRNKKQKPIARRTLDMVFENYDWTTSETYKLGVRFVDKMHFKWSEFTENDLTLCVSAVISTKPLKNEEKKESSWRPNYADERRTRYLTEIFLLWKLIAFKSVFETRLSQAVGTTVKYDFVLKIYYFNMWMV